ncbi:taste receptor type 2 member 39-like [Pelobates fuscus]|uniref:taste receptor type 2 member 39-like n=1 Tax=Pelobates fuscus TaxID=191477 RepID=UPI002FE42C99
MIRERDFIMDNNYEIIISVLVLETSVGIFLNGFIWFVNFMDFMKNTNISSNNKILLALSVANMVNVICSISGIFLHGSNSVYYYFIFSYVLMFSFASSSWLTACLCFLYFIKIINFRVGFLAQIKLQIDVKVPWLIVVVEVVSFCTSFLFLLAFNDDEDQELFNNTSNILSANPTSGRIISVSKYLIIIFVNNCTPFLIITITTFCTIGFLRLHVRSMKKSDGNTNLESHQTAAKTMRRFLLFYLIFYLEIFIYTFGNTTHNALWYHIHIVLVFIFTPVQSGLLILTNVRLKEVWHRLYLLLISPTKLLDILMVCKYDTNK